MFFQLLVVKHNLWLSNIFCTEEGEDGIHTWKKKSFSFLAEDKNKKDDPPKFISYCPIHLMQNTQ